MIDDSNYEYRGLVASSWDFLRGDPSSFPDRDFYRAIILQSGEPALIVGCGTGRLLLEYRADGMDVAGLDVSPEMLAICRQKARRQGIKVTLHQQLMEAMHLPGLFRTMVIPSSNFQLVTDPDAAQSALERCFAHLMPGGMLVMSFWQMKGGGDSGWGEWWQVAEKDGFQDSKTLRRWERSRYDPDTRLRHTENRYELVEDGRVVDTETHHRSPEMRNYSPNQVRELLSSAGFTDVRAVSGFSDTPAAEEEAVFCVLGEKS